MRHRWEIVTPETPGAGPFTAALSSVFKIGEKHPQCDLWCLSIDVMTFTDLAWIVIANYSEVSEGV